MKNKNLIWLLLPFFAISLALMSYDNGSRADEVAVVNKITPEGEFQSVGTSYYEYTYTKDTITNAANDTLYLPARLRPVTSDFIISYSVTRTSLTGTASIAVKIEESTYKYSGTTPPTAGWATSLNNLGAAADTDATTATEEEIRIPNAYGTSYRCIVDGSGTQTTSYVIRVTLKKKS